MLRTSISSNRKDVLVALGLALVVLVAGHWYMVRGGCGNHHDDAIYVSTAKAIAQGEGIENVSEKHWAIVRFIREYWKEHALAPPVRLLCKESGVSVREVYKLFTSGPARGACRVAGLPKPDGCV